ncbi:hypothetical protein GCM10007872_09900 [Gluconobacter sphaericus NBRC 12467]|uniref:Uncharacterized protein n=1 Tax=Gluconobacter sphaericus NBRC 12467 TaxID=1307951 RepID=A0AA37W972_9PROT|nr:hypothetical protein AA12467_0487 [Gluconobacter sphaericus NBRC 12467]GEB41961.1 hypothetical protein GSP01_07430 [Gluconobacter sphaericus NBRC 12467]GLQ84082.1 hypothetical protein GCM10007872_09900 [Gluconobacter sphaericus NBRC 12467]
MKYVRSDLKIFLKAIAPDFMHMFQTSFDMDELVATAHLPHAALPTVIGTRIFASRHDTKRSYAGHRGAGR